MTASIALLPGELLRTPFGMSLRPAWKELPVDPLPDKQAPDTKGAK